MTFWKNSSFHNGLAVGGLAGALVAIFFSTPLARSLPFGLASTRSAPQQAPSPYAPVADDRFGVVLTDNSDSPRTLDLLGLSWYLDYTMDTRSVPAGAVKALKLQTSAPPAVSEVQTAARSYPSAYWIIGNEPNAPSQDAIEPEAYARVFQRYAAAIKEADPGARIAGPEILNFDYTCSGCPGFPSGRQWLEAFLAAYQRLYGQDPPVDVWTIHTYDLDWERLPQGDYGVQAVEILSSGSSSTASLKSAANPSG